MVKLKEENVAAIMTAKEKLEARIASEKGVMANKVEEMGEDNQGNEEDTIVGSPSNTILS